MERNNLPSNLVHHASARTRARLVVALARDPEPRAAYVRDRGAGSSRPARRDSKSWVGTSARGCGGSWTARLSRTGSGRRDRFWPARWSRTRCRRSCSLLGQNSRERMELRPPPRDEACPNTSCGADSGGVSCPRRANGALHSPGVSDLRAGRIVGCFVTLKWLRGPPCPGHRSHPRSRSLRPKLRDRSRDCLRWSAGCVGLLRLPVCGLVLFGSRSGLIVIPCVPRPHSDDCARQSERAPPECLASWLTRRGGSSGISTRPAGPRGHSTATLSGTWTDWSRFMGGQPPCMRQLLRSPDAAH